MQFTLIVRHCRAIDFYELYPGTAARSHDCCNSTCIKTIKHAPRPVYVPACTCRAAGVITSDLYTLYIYVYPYTVDKRQYCSSFVLTFSFTVFTGATFRSEIRRHFLRQKVRWKLRGTFGINARLVLQRSRGKRVCVGNQWRIKREKSRC